MTTTATKFQAMPTAEVVETKETALAVIPEAKALEVFLEGKGIDELLAACEAKATAITADASTAKGRAEIKSMAYLVTRTKTAVEAMRKALADEYKEKPKRIDANGKRIKDFLESLQDRVRKPLTDWEEAEKARVQRIKDTIEVIADEGKKAGETSHALGLSIEFVESYIVDNAFAEFKAEAQSVKDSVLAKLYAAKEAALKRESEQAELERLRAEAAKRDQAEREAKIAQEAAEAATREANEKAAREKAESATREANALLAQERAERAAEQARADAEAKAKQAVEEERRKKAEEDAAAQAKAAALQADEDNRWRVHSEILEDLESIGASEAEARDLLTMLINGKIRNIEIIY